MKRSSILVVCGTLALAVLLVWLGVGSSHDRARAVRSADSTSLVPAAPVTTEVPAAPPDTKAVARTPVAPGALRYTGSVVDPDEQGIANATIRFFTPEQEPVVLAETRSDAHGAFVFTADRDWPARLLVRASADGHAQAMAPLDGFEPVEVTLPWLTELHGSVRDAQTGQPIAGASVCWERRTESGRATTGGDGRYRLRDVPADEITVRASAPGHALRTSSALLRGRAPAQLDLALEDGTPLSVQVVDRATGVPVAGAVVTEGSERIAESDGSGRFDLRVAQGQELDLAVQAADYAPLFWTWTVAEIPASPRLPLARWGFIEGRVVDDAGAPLPGVMVHIQDNAHLFFWGDGPPEVVTESEKSAFGVPGRLPRFAWATRVSPWRPDSGIVHTDGAGRFSIAVVPSSGLLLVGVSRRGYVFAPQDDVVVRAGGERVWLDLVGHAAARIHGRATRNGAPCRGRVGWRPAGSPGVVAVCDVRPDGTYELETDRAGEGTLVLIRPETGDEIARADLVVEVGERHAQDLRSVEATARITGRIGDPTGRVPAGVTIEAKPSESSFAPPIVAEIAADGTYTLPVSAGRTYDVVAERGPIRRGRERVAAGATGIDFEIPALAPIELRLVDAATGAPVASRQAMQWCLSWRESGTRALAEYGAAIDVAGCCALELPVGRVDLCLELDGAGYVPRLVEGVSIAGGSEPVAITIELERGTTLELRLRGEREFTSEAELRHAVFLLRADQESAVRGPFEGPTPGMPPPANRSVNGVYLWVRDPSLMHQLVDFDRQGAAELRALAPGRYMLRAFPGDLVFEPARIDVPAPSTPVEIRWSPR